jgi:protease-4
MALRKKKPLVVSVGEMAASGGYYLASTANEIFADSSSIVGSIGVVGGKVGIGDALERYGVHAETFPANKDDPNAKYRAAYSSLLVSWDKPTRERVYDTMVGVYDLFLRRVAEGRGTTVEKIAPSAEGRIFAGDEALKRGLVDHLDGLTAALRRARELGKLPEGARVTVLSSRPRLLDVLGIEDEGGDAESTTTSALARTASAATMLPGLAPSSPGFVALGQLAPELLPFAQSFVPLARGERALVVLPYALSVR